MIYKIKVFPNYSEDKIEINEDILLIYTKEKPEKNKANLAVIKILSKHFNVVPEKIKLKGLTSKNKIATIKD
ncbi:MAG: DUF167 domain-containing protein [Nanoarchaeota archaeon]